MNTISARWIQIHTLDSNPQSLSGRQALKFPVSVRNARIAQAVMHSIRPALPEFDACGIQDISSPTFRTRDFAVLVLLFSVFKQLLEFGAISDGTALGGNERGQLAAARAGMKVLFGSFPVGPGYAPVNKHLAHQDPPVKHKARARIGGQLLSLATGIVGKKQNRPVRSP